jgi:hypothetical protein
MFRETFNALKNIIVWNVTPYNLTEILQSFGGKYCFHLQNVSPKRR